MALDITDQPVQALLLLLAATLPGDVGEHAAGRSAEGLPAVHQCRTQAVTAMIGAGLMGLQVLGIEGAELAEKEPAVERGVDVAPLPSAGGMGEAQPDPAVQPAVVLL
mgnify:CR=1 FL=1